MNSLLSILKEAAPTLATIVAGPLGGAAVSTIAKKLGVEETVEAVTGALAADPTAVAVIQEIDAEMARIENEDRGSARNRELEMVKAGAHWFSQLIVPILASGVVGLSFLLIGLLMFRNIPTDQQQIVIFALGFITSSATQVLSYYFGSSQSSKDKTNLIGKK